MATDHKQGGQGNSGAAGGKKTTNKGHGTQSDKHGDGKKGTEGHGGGQGTGSGN